MPRPEPRHPVTIADLTAGLIWPRLLRTFPLAIQPPRVLLGLLIVLWTLIVGAGFDAISGVRIQPSGFAEAAGPFASLVARLRDGFHGAVMGAMTADLPRIAEGFREALLTGPRLLWAQSKGAALGLAGAMLVLVVPVAALLAGGICRMVACDVASDLNLTAAEAVSTARRRWRSVLGATLGPLLLLGILALLIAGLGCLTLGFPGVSIVGGVLYGAFLLLGAAMVLVGAGYAAAGWMLIPAVVVEGTDAIDAVQRAYAYALGRPGRLMLYCGIVVAVIAVSYGVLALLASETIQWTASIASVWTGRPPLGGGVHAFAPMPAAPTNLEGSTALASAAVRWWERLLIDLVAGVVVSMVCTGSTLLYLLLRRVNDEQDIEDIWSPEARAAVSLPAADAAPVESGA